MRYAITGGTGHLGSEILQELTKLVSKDEIKVGVHTLKKAQSLIDANYHCQEFDFLGDSLNELLTDVEIFIYVPSKSHDSYSRVSELEKVVAACEKSGVKHILAMGFIADQVNNPFDLSAFYGYLPRRLAESNLKYTIIRNALYADPLVPYLPELIERQHVIYPMADEALSFISLHDSAKAFAKVASSEDLLIDGKIYTLTQTRNYSMKELSKVLSEVAGSQITYEPMAPQEFEKTYDQNGEGHMLSSMYAGGALGLLDEVSPDYQSIMGQEPTSLKDFLQRNYSVKERD